MAERPVFPYPPLSITDPTVRSLLPIIFDPFPSFDHFVLLTNSKVLNDRDKWVQSEQEVEVLDRKPLDLWLAIQNANFVKPLTSSDNGDEVDPELFKLYYGVGRDIIQGAKAALKHEVSIKSRLALDIINSYPRLDIFPEDFEDGSVVGVPPFTPFTRIERQRLAESWDIQNPKNAAPLQLLSTLLDQYEMKTGIRFIIYVKKYTLLRAIKEVEYRLKFADDKESYENYISMELDEAAYQIISLAKDRWRELVETMTIPR